MDKSTLFIERLIILKSSRAVYDEEFHRGINVIRGDHSVGKTTILEMLFYVLGGEIKANQWLYPADKCDEILCQLRLNGNQFTIKREIDKGKVPPISIRSGPYQEGDKASSDWKTYGSRRSESGDKMSFSQQIFELLGWDSHKSDDYANLTMHQILRFLYVDQETASTKILRAEDSQKGDSEGIRTAISEFLLGLDNLDTHKLRQQLIMLEREYDKISSDLLAMYKVLGGDSSLTLSTLESIVVANITEIVKLRNKPKEIIAHDELDVTRASKFNEIDGQINLLNRKIIAFKEGLMSTNGDIVDCELYEKSLKFRKKSLLESKASYDAIGLIKYESCPCCLEKITTYDEGECHLCHAPIVDSHHANNYMELLTEIDFQISSNNKVLEDYMEHRIGITSALNIANAQLTNLQSELTVVSKIVDFSSHSALEDSKRIGFLESENENIKKKIEIISELDRNKAKKIELSSKITDLRNKIESARSASKNRRQNVYSGISENMIPILRKDKRDNGMPYEEVFEAADSNDIEIDFAKDRTLIDGRVKFSGSSNYIKKNSFQISALLEAIDDPNYRLPRFLMLDAIENGGMKEFRSHNFQRAMIDCFKDRNDFQLIFCTSMVLEELNNDTTGVGPFYDGNVLNL
ncbi:MAG: hypothetical protein GYB20_02590 [Oceanospirillales bacterium]|nr:hypothetical protein [Oceanospirillales bacterium]MBR9886579.1 hypothetical protein [Oceanospirillales bacterium]